MLTASFRIMVAFAAFALMLAAGPAGAQVKISEIYTAGGNSGAVYNTDFIELHNPTGSPVDISTWSLQYASATGTTISSRNLFTATTVIPAYTYYLVATGAVSTTNGVALPTTADVSFTAGIAMGAGAGKLFLVNNQTDLSPANVSSGATIVDMVGYGTATNFEGGSVAPAPSTTLALFRAGQGATDTNNNGADFTTGNVNGTSGSRLPRNSSVSEVADWTMLEE